MNDIHWILLALLYIMTIASHIMIINSKQPPTLRKFEIELGFASCVLILGILWTMFFSLKFKCDNAREYNIVLIMGTIFVTLQMASTAAITYIIDTNLPN